MKKALSALVACILLAGCCNCGNVVKKGFTHAAKQLEIAIEKSDSVIAEKWPQGDTVVNPRTFEKGKYKLVKPKDWTSGFFPGCLWYMYEYTGDAKWMDAATRFMTYIEDQQFNTKTHDTGREG